MKITMIMRYLKIEDLFPEESLFKKLWELLEDIRKSLIIDAPSTSTSIDFDSKDGEKLKILKQLEKKEKVLKILKVKSNSVFVKVSKNKFDLLYKKVKQEVSKLSLEKQAPPEKFPRFDPLNGNVFFKGRPYTPRTKTRKLLLRKLWEERQEIQNGEIKKRGKSFPKEALAVQAEMIESPHQCSSEIKNQLKEEMRELNRIFKKKEFPIHIKTRGGVQLIVRI